MAMSYISDLAKTRNYNNLSFPVDYLYKYLLHTIRYTVILYFCISQFLFCKIILRGRCMYVYIYCRVTERVVKDHWNLSCVGTLSLYAGYI